MSVLRSHVLVQNHLIMVAGAGSSSGPATDPYTVPGARHPHLVRSTDGVSEETDHWSVFGDGEVSAAERRLRAFAEEQRRRYIVAEQQRADEAIHRRALTATVDWRRVVRTLFRIRRLQRIWGHLGQFLQVVASKELREDLRRQL